MTTLTSGYKTAKLWQFCYLVKMQYLCNVFQNYTKVVQHSIKYVNLYDYRY